MQKIFFIALSLSLVLGLSTNAQFACCKKKTSTASTEQESLVKQAVKQENARIVKLKIIGLTCAGCPKYVATTLKALDGVIEQKVEYPGDVATVKYDATKTSVNYIIKAIEKLGYKSEVQKERKA